MPDLGLVFAYPYKRENGWKQFGFAIGYNRLANFNSDTYFEGKNKNNSILDSFTDLVQLNGGATEDDLFEDYAFDADLAYQTYLLNLDVLNLNQYISVIPNGGAYQSKSISTNGGMGEFSIGFGGSYNDQLYFGVTVAFPNISYTEESTYQEKDKDNEITSGDTLNLIDFKAMVYDQSFETRGNGFNAKFGLIFKPANWVRIGAAIHTPTYYYLSDRYRASMSSTFGDGSAHSYDSRQGSYSYNLTTPFKAIGSLAFIFGQFGLISFDYELTDYSAANLDASDYNFNAENRIINNYYNGFASNLRGGMEWKYEKFAFRAGAAFYSSPFKSKYTTKETDQHMISYTGGIGYREKKYFVDIGYAYSQRSEFYSPYSLSYEAVSGSINKRTDHRVVTTVGFRF
ncbi:MAG: hypothetical protein IPP71_23570 [Bacteroidetes bacterium]|nr:hypothetical protein [Bacteroidota bacterium]